jgi:hypothetical protein
MAGLKHPVKPDNQYSVVRERLRRLANPNLPEAERSTPVSELMVARSAVRSAKLADDQAAEAAAHHAVDVAKRKLGKRRPVWWTDGSPDLNRHLVKNTRYASRYSGLRAAGRRVQRAQSLDLGYVRPQRCLDRSRKAMGSGSITFRDAHERWAICWIQERADP